MAKKKTRPKYKWSKGSPFPATAANAVGCYLERLEESSGSLTTEQILADAQENEESPVRGLLTWDDEEAANKCRLQEVRSITNHLIRIRYLDGDRTEETKGFHHVRIVYADREESVSSYASVATVENSNALREQVVNNALRELNYWRDRYREYQVLFPIIQAIEEAVEEVESAARTTDKPIPDSVNLDLTGHAKKTPVRLPKAKNYSVHCINAEGEATEIYGSRAKVLKLLRSYGYTVEK